MQINTVKTPDSVLKKKKDSSGVWQHFVRNKGAVIGMVILAVIVFSAVFADMISPYHPYKQNLSEALQYPSAQHWFGTDEFGRDIFSRILHGGRISLMVGFVSVAMACVGGSLFGAFSGYVGGWLDTLIMRMMDVLLAIPSILLNLSIIVALGSSVFNMMLAVAISNLPRYCRIMRASVLQLKTLEYVEAARLAGGNSIYIVSRHIILNSLAPIIVQASLNVGSAIIACAGLSFIGVGIKAPAPEWGAMLANGRDLLRRYSYTTVFPGLAIILTVLSLNMMGDGLRDAFDPKLRR